MISTLLQSYYNPLLDEIFAEPDEALTTFQSHFQTELFMLKWLLRHKRLALCLLSWFPYNMYIVYVSWLIK